MRARSALSPQHSVTGDPPGSAVRPAVAAHLFSCQACGAPNALNASHCWRCETLLADPPKRRAVPAVDRTEATHDPGATPAPTPMAATAAVAEQSFVQIRAASDVPRRRPSVAWALGLGVLVLGGSAAQWYQQQPARASKALPASFKAASSVTVTPSPGAIVAPQADARVAPAAQPGARSAQAAARPGQSAMPQAQPAASSIERAAKIDRAQPRAATLERPSSDPLVTAPPNTAPPNAAPPNVNPPGPVPRGADMPPVTPVPVAGGDQHELRPALNAAHASSPSSPASAPAAAASGCNAAVDALGLCDLSSTTSGSRP